MAESPQGEIDTIPLSPPSKPKTIETALQEHAFVLIQMSGQTIVQTSHKKMLILER
jgi:hypothetical protein